eukprot:5530805-Lingulodinium_polyedra.AAC.1
MKAVHKQHEQVGRQCGESRQLGRESAPRNACEHRRARTPCDNTGSDGRPALNPFANQPIGQEP